MDQGIYCIKVGNHTYFGSSKQLSARRKQHERALRRNIHHNIILQRTYNKLREKSIEFEVLEYVENIEELFLIEQRYIDEYTNCNLGSVGGGDNLSKHPNKTMIIEKRKCTQLVNMNSMTEEERRVKYGNLGELNGMYGRAHTEEAKNKMSNARIRQPNPRKGVTTSQATKDKLSEIAKKRFETEPGTFTGRHHTLQSKEKAKQTKRERGIEPWAKNCLREDIPYIHYYKLEYQNSDVIQVFIGTKEVAEYLSCTQAAVSVAADKSNFGRKAKGRPFSEKKLTKIAREEFIVLRSLLNKSNTAT